MTNTLAVHITTINIDPLHMPIIGKKTCACHFTTSHTHTYSVLLLVEVPVTS